MPSKTLAAALLCAGLVTGITDGLFSSILSVVFYGSSVERLFQGVASVVVGPDAFKGGISTEMLGILMHFGVAFAWSAVFLIAVAQSPQLRNFIASPQGAATAALVYGPLIWLTMSLGVIQAFTHRPPAINYRWWIQFFGHIPFVAVPIIWSIRRFTAGLR